MSCVVFVCFVCVLGLCLFVCLCVFVCSSLRVCVVFVRMCVFCLVAGLRVCVYANVIDDAL